MSSLNQFFKLFGEVGFQEVFRRFGIQKSCQFDFLMGGVQFEVRAFCKAFVEHLLDMFKDEWCAFLCGDDVFFERPKGP